LFDFLEKNFSCHALASSGRYYKKLIQQYTTAEKARPISNAYVNMTGGQLAHQEQSDPGNSSGNSFMLLGMKFEVVIQHLPEKDFLSSLNALP